MPIDLDQVGSTITIPVSPDLNELAAAVAKQRDLRSTVTIRIRGSDTDGNASEPALCVRGLLAAAEDNCSNHIGERAGATIRSTVDVAKAIPITIDTGVRPARAIVPIRVLTV